MNLKNNKITVKELLNYPGAREIVFYYAPEAELALKKPFVRNMVNGMTVEQVLAQAGSLVPRETIETVLQELKKL